MTLFFSILCAEGPFYVHLRHTIYKSHWSSQNFWWKIWLKTRDNLQCFGKVKQISLFAADSLMDAVTHHIRDDYQWPLLTTVHRLTSLAPLFYNWELIYWTRFVFANEQCLWHIRAATKLSQSLFVWEIAMIVFLKGIILCFLKHRTYGSLAK